MGNVPFLLHLLPNLMPVITHVLGDMCEGSQGMNPQNHQPLKCILGMGWS